MTWFALRQQTLTGHTGYVYSVAFSPDGQTIVSSSEDQTVRLWTADIDDLLERAYMLIQRDPPILLDSEWAKYGLD